MNSRHQTNNLLQGSHSRGVIFGHEERQALARMTNIESLDGTIHCERTSNGWAIGAQPAPQDKVATLSWDADTEIATIDFDYIVSAKGSRTVRKSDHDYDSDLGDSGSGAEPNSPCNTLESQYKIDVSGASGTVYGVISFYIPNYRKSGNRQDWGLPGLEEDLILVSNYVDVTDIVATRTYTVDGVQTVDEAVTVRDRTNIGATNAENALEDYRSGIDAFRTSHHYLCSLVVQRGRGGGPTVAWMFGHEGKHRTIESRFSNFSWNPTTLHLTLYNVQSTTGEIRTSYTPPFPGQIFNNAIEVSSIDFFFSAGQENSDVSVGIYYDTATEKLTFGEYPGINLGWRSIIGFTLQDSEIVKITNGVTHSWHPAVLTVTPTSASPRDMTEMSWPIRYINANGDQQTDTLKFDNGLGRLHFVTNTENDTTTPDETIDVFVTSGPDAGKRLRLTMIGNNLYQVSSRTNATSNRQFDLTDITGDTHRFILWNTGAFYCNGPHASFPLI